MQFTAVADGGEEIPEEERVAEEDIDLEIHAAPMVLIPSFGRKNEYSFSYGGSGVLPALKNAGFNVRQYKYSGTRSFTTAVLNQSLFNELIMACAEYIRDGIVCTKADFVGYGIGGLTARYFCQPEAVLNDGNYYTFRSYRQGMVRRIVTIATPHKGTLWADYMKGDYSMFRPDTSSLMSMLTYSLLKAGHVIVKPVVENLFFGGEADPGVWDDLSVSGQSYGSFPINVPMYSISGLVKNNVDDTHKVISTTLTSIAFVTSLFKVVSKFVDIRNEIYEARALMNTMELLKGNKTDTFAFLEGLAKVDNVILSRAIPQLRDLFIQTVRSLGINAFLQFSGGFNVSPLITWVYEAAAIALNLFPALAGGGPAEIASFALDIVFAVPEVIFGKSDYDLFVSENSALSDFQGASIGRYGWAYRHSVIAKNQEVGTYVSGLLKRDKSWFKTFTGITQASQAAPAVMSSNIYAAANTEYSEISFDFTPENFYTIHFDIHADTDTLSVKDTAILRITANSYTDIDKTVFLAVQKKGYDTLLPMISADMNTFEAAIEFTSQDTGEMTAYCFVNGGNTTYISPTICFTVKPALDSTEIVSLSFGGDSSVIFADKDSQINPQLCITAKDGSVIDVSSPAMGW